MKAKSRIFVFILLLGVIVFITGTIIQAEEVRGVTDDTIKVDTHGRKPVGIYLKSINIPLIFIN